jgi:hypothetical protein
VLKELAAQKKLHNPARVDAVGLPLDPLADPFDPIRKREVHELNPEGAAIDVSPAAFGMGVKFGMGKGRKAPERIQIGLKISPATEGVGDRVRGPRKNHRAPLRTFPP